MGFAFLTSVLIFRNTSQIVFTSLIQTWIRILTVTLIGLVVESQMMSPAVGLSMSGVRVTSSRQV
jgi:predicted branched-subunit amino acid permease